MVVEREDAEANLSRPAWRKVPWRFILVLAIAALLCGVYVGVLSLAPTLNAKTGLPAKKGVTPVVQVTPDTFHFSARSAGGLESVEPDVNITPIGRTHFGRKNGEESGSRRRHRRHRSHQVKKEKTAAVKQDVEPPSDDGMMIDEGDAPESGDNADKPAPGENDDSPNGRV